MFENLLQKITLEEAFQPNGFIGMITHGHAQPWKNPVKGKAVNGLRYFSLPVELSHGEKDPRGSAIGMLTFCESQAGRWSVCASLSVGNLHNVSWLHPMTRPSNGEFEELVERIHTGEPVDFEWPDGLMNVTHRTTMRMLCHDVVEELVKLEAIAAQVRQLFENDDTDLTPLNPEED